MRIRFVTIFLLLAITSLANEEEELNEVWIDGSSFYKSIAHKKKSTIYFKEWSSFAQQFLEDENYFVALQLDLSFDPIPNDQLKLPKLEALAAIDSDSVLYEYLSFLESHGRTKGINYMILPDTSEMAPLEKKVIMKANQTSPFYFLSKSILNHSIPDSKKDFYQLPKENPTIWVAQQDQNLNRIQRWSSRRLDQDQFNFFQHLRDARSTSFDATFDLERSLEVAIFKNAVIAIDPNELLPLKDDVVCYLGDDSELRDWLSKYTEVLDKRIQGVRTISDLRSGDRKSKSGDLIISNEMIDDGGEIQLVLPMEDRSHAMMLSQMLFGAHEIKGKHASGRIISNQRYLGYSNLKEEAMSVSHYSKMDSIASLAISRFATPGMQLTVVRNGKVVWENSYGYFTYDSLRKIEQTTMYDVASVTKVMATLPAIALLIDQKKLSLEDSISQHLQEFAGSNKSGVTIKQLLAHQGGLRSYIPFWSLMMDGDRLDAFYYKSKEDEEADIRTYGLEPHPALLDTLKSFLVQSDLIKKPENYNYSDLGFMILHLIVEQVSGMPFDEFLTKEFYQPMGLVRTTFNPAAKGFSYHEITPTEYDLRYRNYQVWGEVHDRNASVFGGVSGHAGLFSNATDLAKMMSMFLNGGYYGGKRYLSEEVLNLLNLRYFENNRRGLGWDKKDGKKDSASEFASDESFGHTGFTGTMVWADPKENLIFVFLSNRIYPYADNWKLGELNTRTQMHDLIYQSIK